MSEEYDYERYTIGADITRDYVYYSIVGWDCDGIATVLEGYTLPNDPSVRHSFETWVERVFKGIVWKWD
jgi:hypothetical protein